MNDRYMIKKLGTILAESEVSARIVTHF